MISAKRVFILHVQHEHTDVIYRREYMDEKERKLLKNDDNYLFRIEITREQISLMLNIKEISIGRYSQVQTISKKNLRDSIVIDIG